MRQSTTSPPEMSSRAATSPPPPLIDMSELPPQDIDAEQAVLGATMFNHKAVDEVRAVLDPSDFYRPAHETIWRAVLTLRTQDDPTDPIALAHHLNGTGDLRRVGGAAYLHTLVNAVPSVSNAGYYAQIVRSKAELRRLRDAGLRTVERVQEPGADPAEIRTAVEEELRAERERALASGNSRLSRYLVDGWDFVTKEGAATTPLWGTEEQAAWASGEALMIVGAPGVGKTTLAHQVVLARLGLQEAVLDLPVQPGERVLYLAMDRPKQIARAMRRRVLDVDEPQLRDRLRVWQGPLPASLDKEPDLLAELAAAHGADTVVIDSLKDAVTTLVDDSLAIAYQNARMRALRAGVELMELHHQRKLAGDAPRNQRPNLDRVYGSTWLTTGAGSVLFISGEAGDPAVTLHHLKSPTVRSVRFRSSTITSAAPATSSRRSIRSTSSARPPMA